MKPPRKLFNSFLGAAALAAVSISSQAGTITFAEFDGLANNAAIPSDPQGLPDGITATWTGFLLHTTAGDTPMSVFPVDDIPGGTIAFSAPVVVPSFNFYDTDWGDAVTIIASLKGVEVWRYVSPGDAPWQKLTVGADKVIDSINFQGQWNHYDDIVVEAAPTTDADNDGLPDIWEQQYFPGDLTKLSGNGDFDSDGLKDSEEYTRGTNPTKADTDGDGLSDKVETNTGTFVSPTDTGTDPNKADTDGDGRKDGDEVNGTPTSDPFQIDTDGDTYSDGEEVASGYNPNDPADNPEATAIANSKTQFSSIQGQDDWFWGYRNYTKDGGGDNYDVEKGFIAFTEDQWTGQWDLDPVGENPWTELAAESTHPNSETAANAQGYDTGVHWTIRRWVANQITKVTPLALHYHVHKSNTGGGNGVTGALYINGQRKDAIIIAGTDGVGLSHVYFANVAPGDKIDLILSPRGQNGVDDAGSDGSVTRLLIDTRIPAEPRQPDGSLFIPAGATDSDGDGIPDVWEKSFFPNDLTKLSATGDYDKDGLNDLGEYQRGTDPTKPDTDGDGLSDNIETNTGVFKSKTDTGSDPTKKDTDGDGLTDDMEVNRTQPTDPNKADTDMDGFTDPEEINWGTNPNDGTDSPTSKVIANSQAEFSGTQGKNDWFFGYRIYNPTAADTNYNYNASADFVPFPGGDGQGDWDGVNQTWTGDSWDLNTADAGPWTYEAALDVHPNGVNSPPIIDGTADPANEQWTIRRWVAKKLTKDTPVTIIWSIKKTNLAGSGVSGLLFINGQLVDSQSIAGTDGTGAIRRYKVTLKPNDVVDLAHAPVGPTGDRADGNDGSQTWFWVDTRTTTAEPPSLSVQRTATGLTLTFTGTLQAADAVTGPYSDAGTTSPVTVSFTSAPMKFYRAKQ